jgi:hypothetical protein
MDVHYGFASRRQFTIAVVRVKIMLILARQKDACDLESVIPVSVSVFFNVYN